MAEMRNLNQFLKNRNGRWHYRRRVPSAYEEVDKRGTIRTSLRTLSIDVARVRRDTRFAPAAVSTGRTSSPC